MDIEDKRSTRLPSVGQKTLESEGRASLSFLVDGARISSSFSIPLSIHNHERESQKFPFPFAPPFALSDLEPAVLANYLTALDSASARDSPYIDLISPLSFDTRALGVDIDFGGAKTKERAKSGPQIQKNRTSKDIKRTQSFSALPPESIQGVSLTYRPNGTSFSSMDLGNWRTNRSTGCWKSQMSDQFFSQDESEPFLSQQNTPKHLRTNSQFSITFGVKRVKSNESKKSKQFDDDESAMIGLGSGRSEISDSGTVEEVVHGFEESNFTTFPVASTFVFDGLVVPAPETKETPHSMLTVL
ncbi:hypothetical protein O6H91_06G036200 [Diphasiastrum complanatum]|nr:hypothetical protein O6H91_06G036200 [Diphasiastrum complanatum]